MSSDVPDGWTVAPLSRCGEWLSGGTPSRQNADYWQGEIPWISAKSLHDFYVADSTERVTPSGAAHGTRLVPAETILMLVRGMALANDFRVGITQRAVTFNQDLKAILPDKALVEPLYLALYLLGAEAEVLGMVSNASHGTCKLDTDRLGALRVCLPSLVEQRKIAAILSAVDAAIEATQAVIEQARPTRDGLLLDLLKRGLGQSRLRRTEIGEVPESWGVVPLGHVLSNVVAGRSPAAPDEIAGDSEWGVLKVSAVVHGAFRRYENKRLPPHYEVRPEHRVKTGDVLFTRANTATLVAACCRVPPSTYRLMLCDKTLRLEPDLDRVTPRFLVALLGRPAARRYFAQVATGSSASMKNVSQAKLRAHIVPLPPLSEQRAISDILEAFDAMSVSHRASLSTLHRTKAGLLQDLLTGKVRVTV